MRLPRPHVFLGALTALLAASCAGRQRWPAFRTQEWPEPMEATVDPLPPGVERNWPPGPEEVIVRRLADPVQLKPPGQHAAIQLRYFDKRRRVNSGAWVFCAPGGRAEVLWPTTGTTVVMYDDCTGIVGSPSRGEPTFLFREVDRAVLDLNEGDQIELLGGALLTASSGPWLIDRQRFEILRVKNQTKVPGEVAYRNEVFLLGPGETVDLPLLDDGGAPIPEVPGTLVHPGPGFDLKVYGEVAVAELENGLQVQGSGEHEIEGLGIRLHLDEGEVAQLTGLGLHRPVSAVRRAPEPGPVPEAAEAPEIGTPAAAEPVEGEAPAEDAPTPDPGAAPDADTPEGDSPGDESQP